MDRQTNKWTDKQTNKSPDKQTYKWTNTDRHRQTNRQTNGQKNRQTNVQTNKRKTHHIHHLLNSHSPNAIINSQHYNSVLIGLSHKVPTVHIISIKHNAITTRGRKTHLQQESTRGAKRIKLEIRTSSQKMWNNKLARRS